MVDKRCATGLEHLRHCGLRHLKTQTLNRVACGRACVWASSSGATPPASPTCTPLRVAPARPSPGQHASARNALQILHPPDSAPFPSTRCAVCAPRPSSSLMEAVVAVGAAAAAAGGSLRCPSQQLHSLRGLPRVPFLPCRPSARAPAWRPLVAVAMAKPNWAQAPRHVHRVLSEALHGASSIVLASGAAALVLLHSACPSAVAETFTITFPGSQIGEVNAVQRTLVEAWGIVRETYVDPTFNNQDWDLKLQEVLGDTLRLKTSEAAYATIRSMLATLGDPFTRIVSPREYASFRINNEGALEGVGLLIGSDRTSGRLVVLSPIEGGPAQRAGILTGDELVQIDDVALAGMNNEEVATRLRGRAGTSVTLKVRRAGNVPTMSTAAEVTEITLRRETIVLSPVYSAVIHHVAPSGQEIKTGYVRLSAFSQNAAADMEKAVSELEESGVDSYILDLRNNPGGLVKAGLDVAQMWLDGNETLVNTIDRNGFTQAINLVNGHALTRNPLVVLVNEGSASASEILAGALHDNGRAVLVGTKTYGKGKIQSVTELRDGSALFVTVAKYLSPALHPIDHIGIAPDVKCSPDEVLPISLSGGGASPEALPLDSDSCILTAEHQLDLH